MGEIQKEVLQNRILEKTGWQTGFKQKSVVYKETISKPVYGYGHFEPLRHYAEVHLLLEPLPPGSGIQVSSRLSRDILSLNWQRSILNALSSARLTGVLTNSALTDVKITLVQGRAHAKHTEGQDFRQAALRAVRQGLMKTESVLLEPVFSFQAQVPDESLSRLLYDLQTKEASFSVEGSESGISVVNGQGPVRTLMNYASALSALTKGMGRISMESAGYAPVPVPEPVIESFAYDPEADRRHPAGSVFCVHGAGEFISWQEVEERLHIPILTERDMSVSSVNSGRVSDEEMKRAFGAAGGRNRNEKKAREEALAKQKEKRRPQKHDLSLEPSSVTIKPALPVCLIVDGYNMIYAWPELAELAKGSLHAARERLIDLLVNYQGYKNWSMIVVFDGWKRKDNTGSSTARGSSQIVYTPKGMSADSYIEKKAHDLRGKFKVVAATSDGLIQNSILGSGGVRLSARELELEVYSVNERAKAALKDYQ